MRSRSLPRARSWKPALLRKSTTPVPAVFVFADRAPLGKPAGENKPDEARGRASREDIPAETEFRRERGVPEPFPNLGNEKGRTRGEKSMARVVRND
jgi:hypothetical protein